MIDALPGAEICGCRSSSEYAAKVLASVMAPSVIMRSTSAGEPGRAHVLLLQLSLWRPVRQVGGQEDPAPQAQHARRDVEGAERGQRAGHESCLLAQLAGGQGRGVGVESLVGGSRGELPAPPRAWVTVLLDELPPVAFDGDD